MRSNQGIVWQRHREFTSGTISDCCRHVCQNLAKDVDGDRSNRCTRRNDVGSAIGIDELNYFGIPWTHCQGIFDAGKRHGDRGRVRSSAIEFPLSLTQVSRRSPSIASQNIAAVLACDRLASPGVLPKPVPFELAKT